MNASQRSFDDSMFADEAVGSNKFAQKPFDVQVSVCASLGVPYMDPRFAQFPGGITENVMAWQPWQFNYATDVLRNFGVKVSCIGSPIGKCGLPEDQSAMTQYIQKDVNRACDVADILETALIRMFGFYSYFGDNKKEVVSPEARIERFKRAKDYLAQMAEVAKKRGKVFCLELEMGLFGQTGSEIAEICEHVSSPHLCGLFDGANSFIQQQSTEKTLADWRAMRHVQGPVIHWKDFRIPEGWDWDGDEDTLRHFCPVNLGQSGHDQIFPEFADLRDSILAKYRPLGIDTLRGTAEPHVKGGGQFGGFSSPAGMAVAITAIRLLKETHKISGSFDLDWDVIEAWKEANIELQ